MTNKERQEIRDYKNSVEVEKALQSRCKHGMIFEYCAVCNRVNYKKTIRIPITVKDKETGEDKNILWKREVDRFYIQRWR